MIPNYARRKPSWIELNKDNVRAHFLDRKLELSAPLVDKLSELVFRGEIGKDSPNPHNTLRSIDRMLEKLKNAGITNTQKIQRLIERLNVPPESLYETIRRETKEVLDS